MHIISELTPHIFVHYAFVKIKLAVGSVTTLKSFSSLKIIKYHLIIEKFVINYACYTSHRQDKQYIWISCRYSCKVNLNAEKWHVGSVPQITFLLAIFNKVIKLIFFMFIYVESKRLIDQSRTTLILPIVDFVFNCRLVVFIESLKTEITK